MKWRFLLFGLISCFCAIFAQDKIPITFSVNMKVQEKQGDFKPGTDTIFVRGDFQKNVGDTANWKGNMFTTSPTSGDSIYSITIDFPDSTAGKTFNYKFVRNTIGWENRAFDRLLKVQKPSMVLPTVFFSDDSVVTIMAYNTLNFTADLSSIYGTGDGHFDPDKDSLVLQGLDWVGATVTGGNKKFVENPFLPGIYTCTVEIKGAVNDSTKWKTRAFPESKYFNWGWEVTADKWHKIKENGSVIDVPVFVPDVFPKKPALSVPVNVLFQVNMSNAVNKYDKQKIDPASLIFVGVKGMNPVLGAWGGDWKPGDTTLTIMNDSGLNGDKTAGDKIWSVIVTFPAGNEGGPSLYKYGAHYPGADTLHSGTSPLDNELMSGLDHCMNIREGDMLEIYNVFGSMLVTTGVELTNAEVPENYRLEQNFPNPFNPSTVIRYSISAPEKVSLKVYDLLGRQVADLVNTNQNAGSYEVSFDASVLGSGIYFYKLSTGNYSSVKKMLLLK